MFINYNFYLDFLSTIFYFHSKVNYLKPYLKNMSNPTEANIIIYFYMCVYKYNYKYK